MVERPAGQSHKKYDMPGLECDIRVDPFSMARRRLRSPSPPAKPAAPPRLNVAIVPVARFTLTALATFVDCLRLAADEDDRSRPLDCRWTLLGDAGRPVTASCGIEVGALTEFGEPDAYDYVVVFGGIMHGGQRVSAATTTFLRRAARHPARRHLHRLLRAGAHRSHGRLPLLRQLVPPPGFHRRVPAARRRVR
jgi:hypothetical protein